MYIPKLPEYLLGKYQLIGTVTFSVLFAVVFLNIYIPFTAMKYAKKLEKQIINLAEKESDFEE